MNEVLKTLNNHRSIRKYKDKEVPEEYLDSIVKAIQSAPTSINGQQLSIIAVTDKDKKRKLSQLVGDQKWVDEAPVMLIFCADFYRSDLALKKHNKELKLIDNIEATLVGAVDVGIGMGAGIAAAESLGLGIVPIGAVRKEPEAISDMLELPKYVFPIAGLCVGFPDHDPGQKPRLPKNAVFHKETYDTSQMERLIDEYDSTISNYMKERTEGESDRDWSETVASTYSFVYFPKVSDAIRKKGYKSE
ncbi:NADPH-dependent oxidoreductase [Clostridium sp. D2Q-11]|uniref:NADPH-dependent oxidoreductase n=1 Tax=Anaeromonas frigoriresistens TaxID=2683708 RepID=A0A942UWU6_9FIRM|nr:NADPH-dependent oxidoreductase [Anaeromonas frigoriresistens]